jgi:glycerophosphoryl diester phosphodiesterase
MIINIAHRGYSGKYPENTMLAFQKAFELGVDAIELDVQLSRDGEVMVFHDEELKRTTGEEGLLKDRTCCELKALDASINFPGLYGVNRIPMLTEYLEFAADKDILTFLELKNSMIPYPHLEEKVAALIGLYGRPEKIFLFSANHPSVTYFGSLAPHVRLLFPFDNWIFEYGAYCQKHAVKACMPYYRALSTEVIAEIKAHEVALYPWTIDDEADMRSLLERGVDGILTNRPDRLKRLLQTWEKP